MNKSGDNQEVTIEQMAQMLSDETPVEHPAEKPPQEKPAVDSEGGAKTDAKPADPAVTDESGMGKEEKKPEPGTGSEDTETPKGKDTEKPRPKFGPKPKEETVPESVQKRINKAIWEKHEAERRAEAAMRELEELKKRLEQQASGKPATETTTGKPAQTSSGFSEPEPQEDDYETFAEYVKAVAAWQLRSNLAEERQRIQAAEAERLKTEREKAQAEASAKWAERVNRYAASHPQIHEAIQLVGPFLTQAGQADFIMQSDVGLEIVEYLRDHADEAIRMAQTGDPLAIARELGRLEARLLSLREPTQPQQTQHEKPPEDALPDPVASVGGRAAAPAGIDLSDESVPMEEWSREFRRQIEAVS